MYEINDLVYVFLYDLRISLPGMKKGLLPNRFGKIISKDEIDIQGQFNKAIKYTIELSNGTTMEVNNYNSQFNICNLDELIVMIEGMDTLTDEQFEIISKQIDEAQDLYYG
jgi:hypothetical protein